VPKNASCDVNLLTSEATYVSYQTVQHEFVMDVCRAIAKLTILVLSANFLLIGLVISLTSVPSGYIMRQRGLSSSSALFPRVARLEAKRTRSEVQERERKIKLKSCIPYADD
jgi:hypothetical protein